MTQQLADEDNDEDDILVTGTPSIGLGGGRAMQSRSPMHKNMPQRRAPVVMTQQPADEDGLLVSGTASIGLAGGRAMRSQSPATKNITQKRLPQVTTRKASDKGDDEDDLLVSGRASIGIARGRAMQSRPSMAKTMAQRPVQQVAQQPGDEDNDVDDLANNNSSASGTATIGLACGKAIRSSSPSSVHINQDQPPSTRSTPGSQTSLSVNNMEQPLSSYSSGQPSHSISSVEQPMSPYSISGGQPSLQGSAEQPTAGRLCPLTRSIEQPLSARSTASGRQHLGVKAVPVIPHTVPMPLKPTSSVSSTEASTDNRRDKQYIIALSWCDFSLKDEVIIHIIYMSNSGPYVFISTVRKALLLLFQYSRMHNALPWKYLSPSPSCVFLN
ncbi:uncharacterized protein LOC111277507 [Durio zibethinus]|uniref:Uncharacterized protein LOC111277507 n=1 Tax=Durio zibethinus TaxID=66656 RepID=A0A6P5WVI8_DURZI|nr:uncharacterized protein LOC111277507 [Durio zibethinus]